MFSLQERIHTFQTWMRACVFLVWFRKCLVFHIYLQQGACATKIYQSEKGEELPCTGFSNRLMSISRPARANQVTQLRVNPCIATTKGTKESRLCTVVPPAGVFDASLSPVSEAVVGASAVLASAIPSAGPSASPAPDPTRSGHAAPGHEARCTHSRQDH